MWAHGPWEWFPLMWIFPLIFLVVMLLFLFRGGGGFMCGGQQTQKREETARELLDRRYARGEVSREEYQQMKKDLE
ncbi:SHOCT domain-containing protein [Acidithiobacillus sp. MC6.1]|nr:SHOCT domain-containing protein [Acidithiobacillus sp. MC6.1]